MNEADQAAAQTTIDHVRACLVVKIDKAKTCEVPALVHNVKFLELNNVALPKACKVIFTMRKASFDVSAGFQGEQSDRVISQWAARLSWEATCDDDNWDMEDKPCFAGCSPNTEEEAKDTHFVKMFHHTFFNEAFISAWKASLANGAGPALLIKMARSVVDVFVIPVDTMASWQRSIVEPCLKICRAILAAAWSLPCAFGATLDDVLYLLPDKRTSPIVKDIPAVGKYLLSSAASDPMWNQRKVIYKEFSGVEATEGNVPWKLYLDLRALAPDAEYSAVEPFFKLFGNAAAKWKTTFRPGNTLPHQEFLYYHGARILKDNLGVNETKVIESAVEQMETPEGKQLHTIVMTKLRKGVQTQAIEQFDTIFVSFLNEVSLEVVPSLLNTIRAMKAHAGSLSVEQAKLCNECGVALIQYIRGVNELPMTPDKEFTEPMLQLPALLTELVKHSVPEQKGTLESTSALLTDLKTCSKVHRVMMRKEDWFSCESVEKAYNRMLKLVGESIVQGGKADLQVFKETPFVHTVEEYLKNSCQ